MRSHGRVYTLTLLEIAAHPIVFLPTHNTITAQQLVERAEIATREICQVCKAKHNEQPVIVLGHGSQVYGH